MNGSTSTSPAPSRIDNIVEQARSHWERHLPGFTQVLKQRGLWDQALLDAAQWALLRLETLISQGMPAEWAERYAMNEFICVDAIRDAELIRSLPSETDRLNWPRWRNGQGQDSRARIPLRFP